MKKLSLALAAALVSVSAVAQSVDRHGISSATVEKTDNNNMIVTMQFNPKSSHVKYNQECEITPVFKSNDGKHQLALTPVIIAGKNAYYYTVRNNEANGAQVYKAGKNETVTYTQSVPYENWMINSELGFDVKYSGCCGAEKESEFVPVADLNYAAPQYTASYTYVEPKAVSSKLFNVEGKAYINFLVGKSVIDPDYMNNPVELKKILESIDAVKDNKDAKVTKIKLTGYASPEGSYALNAKLAEARTIALKEYVRKQYAFPESLFETSSVAEDFEGLKAAVAKSELLDKDKILEFLNSDYPIEQRNDRLRALFPESYAFLLKNVYPTLRHTDYVITYEVRKYTDINEIKRVMKTRPQNLSLNEFFLAANTYEPGSPEYDEVFEIAARMYPNDPTANINAAQASISRGDLASAEKFLSKVGNVPEAEYARGVLAAKKGQYENALKHLRNSSDPKAAAAIQQINNILNYKGAVNYK